jgi:hypothetical protein
MMRMFHHLKAARLIDWRACILTAAILCLLTSARAEDDSTNTPELPARRAMNISQEIEAEYSYLGGATTRRGSTDYGSVTEQHSDVKYVLSPQVTKTLLLRFGAEWQRFDFGVPNHAPIPDLLQQFNAVIGCDYQLADQWLLRVDLQPGVYSDFQDISWRDFNMPVVVGGVYLKSADVQFILGMLVDVRSQYPVLPAAGVRWQMTDEWTLDLVLPHPRIEYEANEKLTVYCGADFQAGMFTIGDHFGQDHGNPKLDHASLDYLEIRLGPGLAWKVLSNFTVEIAGGMMLYREYRYVNENTILRSHDAPYVSIACHARF